MCHINTALVKISPGVSRGTARKGRENGFLVRKVCSPLFPVSAEADQKNGGGLGILPSDSRPVCICRTFGEGPRGRQEALALTCVRSVDPGNFQESSWAPLPPKKKVHQFSCHGHKQSTLQNRFNVFQSCVRASVFDPKPCNTRTRISDCQAASSTSRNSG